MEGRKQGGIKKGWGEERNEGREEGRKGGRRDGRKKVRGV